MMSVLKKYFPVVRNKTLLWGITFSIPIVAIITLSIEIIYFHLHMSWLFIFIEVLLIYGYLLMNYMNYRKFTKQT